MGRNGKGFLEEGENIYSKPSLPVFIFSSKCTKSLGCRGAYKRSSIAHSRSWCGRSGQKSENHQFILLSLHWFQPQIQPRPYYRRNKLFQFCTLKCTYEHNKFKIRPLIHPSPFPKKIRPCRSLKKFPPSFSKSWIHHCVYHLVPFSLHMHCIGVVFVECF